MSDLRESLSTRAARPFPDGHLRRFLFICPGSASAAKTARDHVTPSTCTLFYINTPPPRDRGGTLIFFFDFLFVRYTRGCLIRNMTLTNDRGGDIFIPQYNNGTSTVLLSLPALPPPTAACYTIMTFILILGILSRPQLSDYFLPLLYHNSMC